MDAAPIDGSQFGGTQLWLFLLLGYVATVMVELPVLYVGLAPRHSRRDRVIYGLLLTAFSYPVVVLVLPAVFALLRIDSRAAYLAIAETYAPVSEALFFRFLTSQRMLARPDRDVAAIVLANLASFLLGEMYLSARVAAAIGWLTNLG